MGVSLPLAGARLDQTASGRFASQAEAARALRKVLDRIRPGGRTATLTLGELVDEYLAQHTGERVTIAKLRWLLGEGHLGAR